MATWLLPGCTPAVKSMLRRDEYTPMVVVVALGAGARIQFDVRALTLTGQHVFMSASMNERNTMTMAGSITTIPDAVRVRWRAAPAPGQHWTTGAEEGDYTIAVRSRIPRDVLDYVAAKGGRALVLRFRLKDDAVLLAWDVQERGQYGLSWTMHGGDFKDPRIFGGKVVEPGWENPRRP